MFYDPCSPSTISKSAKNREEQKYTNKSEPNNHEYLLLKKNENGTNRFVQCPNNLSQVYDNNNYSNDQSANKKLSNEPFSTQVFDLYSSNDTKTYNKVQKEKVFSIKF